MYTLGLLFILTPFILAVLCFIQGGLLGVSLYLVYTSIASLPLIGMRMLKCPNLK